MSKLTLNVDDKLIAAAKEEAAARNTSVSKLVSDLFRHFKSNHDLENKDIPPLTASLSGLLKGAESDREKYVDYLEEKHS